MPNASKSNHRLTILGCGSSPGTPRIGGDWGQCDPNNPKNRRQRCSALFERFCDDNVTRILVDTGPDFRNQMLQANVDWADGVVYTHPHADHLHGIDDLRAFVINRRQRVDVYANELTTAQLYSAFGYCFETPAGSSYPPILNHHSIDHAQPVIIDGPAGSIELLPYNQVHGDIHSLGFRCGNIAYSSDVSDLEEQSIDLLQNLDVWIVDALRYTPHASHFCVDQVLEWTERLKPKRTILTHMHIDLDYEALRSYLPDSVEPAYDGMTIDFSL
ncbi:MAG: MBL fold metallo-hydrolase [Cohaesibacter sp.]|nr:MBL fold metallo-hydrolase [Cohaesibacter sp.]